MVKNVVASFLRQQGYKPIIAKGAGPDIFYDGIPIEVKGSKFDFKDAIRQLTRYAFTHSASEVALPVDAADLDFLLRMRSLESSIRSWRVDSKCRLSIYLIAAKDKELYAVRKYMSAEDLFNNLLRNLEQEFYISKYGDEDIDSVISKIQTSLLELDSLVIKTLERDAIGAGHEISVKGEGGG